MGGRKGEEGSEGGMESQREGGGRREGRRGLREGGRKREGGNP